MSEAGKQDQPLHQFSGWQRVAKAVTQGATSDEALTQLAEAAREALALSACVFLAYEPRMGVLRAAGYSFATASAPPVNKTGLPFDQSNTIAECMESGKNAYRVTIEPTLRTALIRISGNHTLADRPVTLAPINAGVRGAGQADGLALLWHARATESADEQAQIEWICAQAGVCLRLNHLQNTVQSSANRLDAVNRVGNLLASTLDRDNLDELYALIHQQIKQVMDAEAFFVATYDEHEESLRFPYMYDDQQRFTRAPQRPGPGPTGVVIRTRQPVVLATRQELQEKGTLHFGNPTKRTTSALYVPMLAGERLVGLVSVQSYREHAYTPEDVQLVATIAGQAAVAIENGRLYSQVGRRLERLSILHEVALAATASLDFDQIIHETVNALHRTFGFENIGLALLSPRGDRLKVHPSYIGGAMPRDMSVALGEGITGWVAQTGLPARLDDVRTDPRYMSVTPGVRAELCVPLRVQDRTIGVINAESPQTNAFSLEDEQLLTIIAGQLAPLIDRARLYTESQQRVRELGVLYDASMATAALLDQGAILQAVVEHTGRALNASSAYICEWDEQHGVARVMAEYFSERANARERISDIGQEYPVTETPIAAQSVRSGKPFRVSINDLRTDAAQRQHLRQYGATSSLTIPLVTTNSQVLGFVELWESASDREWTTDEVRLGQTIVIQAALALEKARLYAQTRQRVEELDALRRSSIELTGSLDLPTVLDHITENALRLVGARDVHLYVYNDATGTFTLGVARWGVDVPHNEVHTPRKEGLTAQVVRDRQPIIINDTLGHPFFSNPDAQRWEIRSIAGFPLKRAERLLGVFNVAFREPHAFAEDELRVLTLLGDQAAVAIDNARLYEEARRRAEQVSALLATTAIISSTLDLDTRLNTIAEKAKALVEADGVTLFSLEEDGTTLRPLIARRKYQKEAESFAIMLGEGLTGRVAQTGVGEIVNHAELDTGTILIPGTPEEPECLVSVPLLFEQRIIGVMTLQREGDREFTHSDLDLLSSFASQASVAIENAKLYHDANVRAQTLQRAYDELAEADRLKDELVQNVSHELRTPLTFIKGYVELLVAGELGEMATEQTESLKIVLSKTDVLVRLVSDVVSLQAISAESLELTEVPIQELARRALAGIEPTAQEAGIHLKFECPPDMPRVYADVDRVAQVLDNLLGNALKFSPKGGTIGIQLTTDQRFVSVEVSDTGIGIPPEKQKRVFERFYQVDGSTTRRFGGAGLGLAISKQIIDAHRGEIGIARSAPGAGTTFYFKLLCVPADDHAVG